jgi:hypothetical protein
LHGNLPTHALCTIIQSTGGEVNLTNTAVVVHADSTRAFVAPWITPTIQSGTIAFIRRTARLHHILHLREAQTTFARVQLDIIEADILQITFVKISGCREHTKETNTRIELHWRSHVPFPILRAIHIKCHDPLFIHHNYVIPYSIVDISSSVHLLLRVAKAELTILHGNHECTWLDTIASTKRKNHGVSLVLQAPHAKCDASRTTALKGHGRWQRFGGLVRTVEDQVLGLHGRVRRKVLMKETPERSPIEATKIVHVYGLVHNVHDLVHAPTVKTPNT